MRISKLCLAVCAVALCGRVVAVRGDDNPAQAAARAALEAKMGELNAQATTTNAPAAPAMLKHPTQPAIAATAPTTSPPAEKPQTTKAEHAAPAPMMNKTNKTNVQRTQPSVTAVPSVTPAQTTKPVASKTTSSNHGLFTPVPPPSGGIPAEAASGENLPSSTNSAAPAAVQIPALAAVPFVPAESTQTVKAAFPGKELGLKPITSPPPPISTRQQMQLRVLLEKYDANVITPEQYQASRAKILGERH